MKTLKTLENVPLSITEKKNYLKLIKIPDREFFCETWFITDIFPRDQLPYR